MIESPLASSSAAATTAIPAYNQRIDWLHGLRGIAAFMVVFTHARYFFLHTPAWPEINAALVPTAMGVDLFFIISGFIMTYTAVKGHYTGPLDFGIKRLARVWPPYAVMTLVAMVLWNQAGFHSFDSLKPVLRSLALIPADPHNAMYFGVTLPLGWTLEFEAYFYLVFAVCLALRGPTRWFALIGWLLFSAVIYPMRHHGFHWAPQVDPAYSWAYANLITNPMVLEFGYGVLIGLLYLSGARIPNARLCWNLLFATVTCALWYCFCAPGAFHGPGNWGAAAAAIVLVLALVSRTVHLRVPALIAWLGTISYSLYLTHTATQEVLIRFLGRLGWDTQNWGFVFLSTCVALVVAYGFHVVVERWLCDRVRDGLVGVRGRIRKIKHGPVNPDGRRLFR
jgi:peptidoglycan/LPS O-acetylase OafA/YrhL